MSRDYEQQQQHQIIESYQNRCVLSGPNKLRATASGRSAQCSCPEAQEAASQIVSSQVMDFVSALKIVFTGLGWFILFVLNASLSIPFFVVVMCVFILNRGRYRLWTWQGFLGHGP